MINGGGPGRAIGFRFFSRVSIKLLLDIKDSPIFKPAMQGLSVLKSASVTDSEISFPQPKIVSTGGISPFIV
jgi:hypothetical protein